MQRGSWNELRQRFSGSGYSLSNKCQSWMRRKAHPDYRSICPSWTWTAVTQLDGTEPKWHQSSIPQPRVLAEFSVFGNPWWIGWDFKRHPKIVSAFVSCWPLGHPWVKPPAFVTRASFYPPGNEAPAQQEQCGNVGKRLYYFKSRLL